MTDVNPYRAPEPIEDAEDQISSAVRPGEYASRPRRLAGAILDGMIVGLPQLVLFRWSGWEAPWHGQNMAMVFDSLAGMVLFFMINGVLIYTRGQTVGKMCCGMVVVTKDFRVVSGNRYVFLRLLPMWLITMVPFVGEFLVFADSLAIFRPENNCIHDDIAGTRVIRTE
jgi:uncharacterized RDD family membrane protein YckC